MTVGLSDASLLKALAAAAERRMDDFNAFAKVAPRDCIRGLGIVKDAASRGMPPLH